MTNGTLLCNRMRVKVAVLFWGQEQEYNMMLSKSSSWLVWIALIFAVPIPTANANNTENDSNRSIYFSACELKLPGTGLSVKAECGSRMVAENPADVNGRNINLNLARIPARKQDEKAPDPIFFFAGGPGQSATEAYPIVAGSLAKSNEYRDIILIDQRGTGGSNKLSCDQGEPELEFELDIDEVVQLTRECIAELDADPRFYTTTIAMQDIDQIREALGYQQINLVGVSYGTRAAQVYLRQYPQHVRSVVLDSVVPPQLLLGLEHAHNLDVAVSKIFDRCQRNNACNDRFGNLERQLQDLRQRIIDQPPQMRMRMPTSGEFEDILVTRDVLAVAMRLLSYSSETQALLPILLEQASLGDWKPLASQALMQVQNLDDLIARGMELSVICSEDVPFFPQDIDQTDTLLGQLLIELSQAQCDVWPKGDVPDDYHQPVSNDQVPVLLLSGEYDPVTPPEYGDLAAEQFARSMHWVIPGRGHSVLRHGCLPEQVAVFFESADFVNMDNDCTNNIGPMPFFLSMTGPSP